MKLTYSLLLLIILIHLRQTGKTQKPAHTQLEAEKFNQINLNIKWIIQLLKEIKVFCLMLYQVEPTTNLLTTQFSALLQIQSFEEDQIFHLNKLLICFDKIFYKLNKIYQKQEIIDQYQTLPKEPIQLLRFYYLDGYFQFLPYIQILFCSILNQSYNCMEQEIKHGEQENNSSDHNLFSLSNKQKLPQNAIKVPSNQTFTAKYQAEIASIQYLQNLRHQIYNKVKPPFSVSTVFEKQLSITIQSYDIQSILVQAHFGYLRRKISVLITDIQPSKYLQETGNGQYGSILLYKDENSEHIFKNIDIVIKDGRIQLNKIYKEFFMASLASLLQVGPKIQQFFKYDIVIFREKAWFSMQKCQTLNSSMKNIKSQLIDNLKVLHSFGFMHLDIKPDNIAFSPKLNKVVFLDFGFSSLVQQKLGYKTLHKFCGTLAYCSEQMRGLYYYPGKKYLDLYHNDLVCLTRSLKKLLGYNMLNLTLADKFNQAFRIEQTSAEQKKDDKILQFQSILKIVHLKYCIFFDLVQEILKISKSSSDISLSIYTILSSEYLKGSITNNIQIRKHLAQIKRSLVSTGFKTSYFDDFLMKILKKNPQQSLYPSIISIKHIIELPKMKFNYFIACTMEVEKIFMILNPLSNFFPKEKNQNVLQYIFNLRKKIIQKIYQHLQERETIFYEKVSTVTHFFYKRLGPQRKKYILLALRLMFILLKDPICTKLDFQIIQSIQDRRFKLLYLIEFQLFQTNRRNFFNKTTDELYGTFLKILDDEGVKKKKSPYLTKQQIVAIMVKLEQKNFYETLNQEGLQIIQNIQSFVQQMQEHGISTSERTQHADNFHHKVYSLMYYSQKREIINNQESDFAYFCRIYQKISIKESQTLIKSILLKNVRKLLQISARINLPFPYFLFREYSENFRQVQVKIFKHSQIFLEVLDYQKQLKNIPLCYSLFSLFKFKLKQAGQQEVAKKIWTVLENLFLTIKLQQGLQLSKNPTIYQSVLFSQIEIMYLAINQPNQKQIIGRVRSLFNMFLPFNKQTLYILENITCLQIICCSYFLGKWQMPIYNFLIQLAETYIEQGVYSIFQYFPNLLSFASQGFNIKGNYSRGFQIIQLFVQKIKKQKRGFYNLGLHWESIKLALLSFCLTAPIQFVGTKFLEYKKMHMNQISNYQMYIQFLLFHHLFLNQNLNSINITIQILRIIRVLNNPNLFVKFFFQPALYKILRKSKIQKSKRKMLIYLKKEWRYIKVYQLISRQMDKKKCQPGIKSKIKGKLQRLSKYEGFGH